MSARFDSNASYVAERDVRAFDRLEQRMHQNRNRGRIWPLIGARRSGKTWALAQLAARLEGEVLDLRSGPELLFNGFPRPYMLFDEPGTLLLERPRMFVDRCCAIAAAGKQVIIAMTPGEWSKMSEFANVFRCMDVRQREFLAPLTMEQAQKLARTEEAKVLLESLPEVWTRNAFVLELIFETAELKKWSSAKVEDLLEIVEELTQDAPYEYARQVFHEGLSESQQAALHGIWKELPMDKETEEVLASCGLIEKGDEPRSQRIVDPLLARHLPAPLIIHHLSDIHCGPKSAQTMDIKLGGSIGQAVGNALGQGTIRAAYLEHLRTMRRSANLLIVSGDLAERGTEEEFVEARDWLRQAKQILGPHERLEESCDRILLVAGNHDVDWEKSVSADPKERHQCFAKIFAMEFKYPALHEEPKDRELCHAKYSAAELDVVLLGSSVSGGELDREVRELLEVADDSTPYGKQTKSVLLRFARLDPALVHAEDLRALKEFSPRALVRIAVLHHPLSALPATEADLMAGVLNAGAIKNVLFEKRFTLVLHGHSHKGWFGKESWPGIHSEHELRFACAPTLGSQETTAAPGFNEIELQYEGPGRVTVTVRRFLWSGTSWNPDNSPMGPFVVP